MFSEDDPLKKQCKKDDKKMKTSCDASKEKSCEMLKYETQRDAHKIKTICQKIWSQIENLAKIKYGAKSEIAEWVQRYLGQFRTKNRVIACRKKTEICFNKYQKTRLFSRVLMCVREIVGSILVSAVYASVSILD